MEAEKKTWLRPGEAAEVVGISRQTLLNLVKRGDIPREVVRAGVYQNRPCMMFNRHRLIQWNVEWIREKPWRSKFRERSYRALWEENNCLQSENHQLRQLVKQVVDQGKVRR